MRELEIHQQYANDLLILRLRGRLDAMTASNAGQRITEFIAAKSGPVLLDFTGVDYLSSSGMRILLTAYKELKEQKRKLAVCSVTDGVMDVLRMSGFLEVIPIYDTESKARGALEKQATPAT